jgi:hypothetical protein
MSLKNLLHTTPKCQKDGTLMESKCVGIETSSHAKYITSLYYCPICDKYFGHDGKMKGLSEAFWEQNTCWFENGKIPEELKNKRIFVIKN